MFVSLKRPHLSPIIQSYSKKTSVIPFVKSYTNDDLNRIKKITNNKNISHVLKLQLIQEYFSILDKHPNSKNHDIIWQYRSNLLIKNYKSNSDIEIVDVILKRENPIKQILLDHYDKLDNRQASDSEYIKRSEWINYVLKLPTTYKFTNISNEKRLRQVRSKIDAEIYQMDSAKDDLLSIIYSYATNPKSSNNSIALYGSPGVGKTALVRQFATLIDLPFVQISIGNINDASYLVGHTYTYVSSEPGNIVKSIIKLGFKNGIIFLDEIDKLSDSSRGSEILGTLMHLCDFAQNNSFEDKYLDGIPIDMSGYLFVYSLNDMNKMNPALLSRIGQNIIKVPDYVLGDKIIIAEKYIIPKILSEFNISPNQIQFSSEIISYIITDCIQISSKGIRELKAQLLKIIRMVNYFHIIKPKEYVFPLILTKSIIDVILNKNNSDVQKKYIF